VIINVVLFGNTLSNKKKEYLYPSWLYEKATSSDLNDLMGMKEQPKKMKVREMKAFYRIRIKMSKYHKTGLSGLYFSL